MARGPLRFVASHAASVARRACRAAVALAVPLALAVSPGCAESHLLSSNEKVVLQETQLKKFVAQANSWGADILAWVPMEEVEPATESHNIGGVRKANEYEEWPKYYYWDQILELNSEGARAPSDMADDLEPWLEKKGWRRDEDSEFPPGEQSFERDYYRDGYHLVVEVYTLPPSQAQTIAFTIVTPQTDADH